MAPALIMAIGLVGAICIILLGLWERYRVWQDMQGLAFQAVIFLAVVLCFDLLYLVTFELPRVGTAGLSGVAIILGALALLWVIASVRFFFLLRARLPNRASYAPPRLLGLWDWDQRFPNAIWGDVVNVLAVLAGVGARNLFANDPGWWWAGQIGALLAVIVGFVFFQRWLFAGVTDNAESSVLNILIGVFTALALFTPTGDNLPLLAASLGLIWFWIIFLGLLALIFLLVIVLTRFNQYRTVVLDRYKLSMGIAALALTGIGFVALLVFALGAHPPAALIVGFGLVAAFAWLLAELFTLARLAKLWYATWNADVNTYTTFEKNIWQLLSASIIVVVLCTKLFGDISALSWTLTFAITAAFAGFGVLRSIVAYLIGQRAARRITTRTQGTVQTSRGAAFTQGRAPILGAQRTALSRGPFATSGATARTQQPAQTPAALSGRSPTQNTARQPAAPVRPGTPASVTTAAQTQPTPAVTVTPAVTTPSSKLVTAPTPLASVPPAPTTLTTGTEHATTPAVTQAKAEPPSAAHTPPPPPRNRKPYSQAAAERAALLRQILIRVTQTLAILLGIGVMPMLSQQIGAFWVVGLLVGVLAIGIDLYLSRNSDAAPIPLVAFVQQKAQQLGPLLKNLGATLRPRLQNLANTGKGLFQKLSAQVQRVIRRQPAPPVGGQTAAATHQSGGGWLQGFLASITARLRRQPRPPASPQGASVVQTPPATTQAPAQVMPPPSTAALPGATIALPVTPLVTGAPEATSGAAQTNAPTATGGIATPPPPAPSQTAPDALGSIQAWLGVITPTSATGAFVILAALIALILRSNEIEQPGILAMYFALPALLLWMIVEGVRLYTNLILKPKRLAQIFGIAASTTQILGALLLWIYLGLALALKNQNGVFWVAAGLIILGALLSMLAIIADSAAKSRLTSQTA